MMEGTKNKTPQELEEEIEKLGAYININASATDISISVNTLARNYEKTLALVEEILLEPRWDAEEFEMAKSRLQNRLLRAKADPNTLARDAFMKLVYGPDHIFSIDRQGNETTVATITIDDLKAYYETNFSPLGRQFPYCRRYLQEKVMASLKNLDQKWKAKEVYIPGIPLPVPPRKHRRSILSMSPAPNNRSSISAAPACRETTKIIMLSR